MDELHDANPDALPDALQALRRIHAGDAAVGAFVALSDAATVATQLLDLPGGTPLAGAAVALKDIYDSADFPSAYGSPIYAGHRPRVDAAIIGAIRRAGGIVIGKTSTTEFAFLEPTTTRNPRAPRRTPGGSSAGSAAAVAAGMVPYAIGTQTAGSIIRPASYCGVAGFKPTFGVLPTAGMKCFSWSLDTVGLFADDVRGVARLGAALSGRRWDNGIDAPSGATLRVGIPDAYPWLGPENSLSASAAGALAMARAALDAAGVRVVTLRLPDWIAGAYADHAVIQGYEAWRALMPELTQHRLQLSAQLRTYLDAAGAIDAGRYDDAQCRAERARQRLADLFDSVDVLLTPSAPDEAPAGYGSTGSSEFNRVWTLLGLPCVNVPGLTGANGHPMGLQVIGAPHAERDLLRAARTLERAIARARHGAIGIPTLF